MAGLRIAAFSGMAPRVSKLLLKDNEAQIALNAKLASGELRARRKPGVLAQRAPVPPETQTIYRHTTTSNDTLWLKWESDVDVVPGPVYDSNENPIYLTGHGSPKKTNSTLSPLGQYLEMGVPNPTTAPSVSASGGSGSAESRTYLYTFISQFGSIQEESGPSPASALVNVLPGGTVTVSGLPSAAPSGAYNITKVRIYRSVTGTNSTPFLKVADVNIGTTSYADTVTAVNLGQVLPSASYEPPPADLKGLVSMANGILAGFRGNEVYFSEPYIPHAWPSSYSLTVEFDIVGIKPFGESLLVATTGNPFVISGASPAAMSQTKLPMYEPCISKRSIASDSSGAAYASPNGVIRVAQGFSGNVTRNLFTRDDWSKLVPQTMLGVMWDNYYFLFYTDIFNENTKRGLILDSSTPTAAVTITTLHTEAAFVEPTTASMYVVEDNEIKEWEGDRINFLPYEWRSKVFILPRPVNFGAAQVEAEYGDIETGEALASVAEQRRQENEQIFASTINLRGSINQVTLNNLLINGSVLKPIPAVVDGRYVLLTIYCNDRMVASINLRSRKPVRLPSGFKGDRWEFQVNGNVPLQAIKIAETAKELVQL